MPQSKRNALKQVLKVITDLAARSRIEVDGFKDKLDFSRHGIFIGSVGMDGKVLEITADATVSQISFLAKMGRQIRKQLSI